MSTRFWCCKTAYLSFSYDKFPFEYSLHSERARQAWIFMLTSPHGSECSPPAEPHSHLAHYGMSTLLSFLFFSESWNCFFYFLFFYCNMLPRQHVETPLRDFCAVFSCDPVDNKPNDRQHWYACCSSVIIQTEIRPLFLLHAARVSFIGRYYLNRVQCNAFLNNILNILKWIYIQILKTIIYLL